MSAEDHRGSQADVNSGVIARQDTQRGLVPRDRQSLMFSQARTAADLVVVSPIMSAMQKFAVGDTEKDEVVRVAFELANDSTPLGIFKEVEDARPQAEQSFGELWQARERFLGNGFGGLLDSLALQEDEMKLPAGARAEYTAYARLAEGTFRNNVDENKHGATRGAIHAFDYVRGAIGKIDTLYATYSPADTFTSPQTFNRRKLLVSAMIAHREMFPDWSPYRGRGGSQNKADGGHLVLNVLAKAYATEIRARQRNLNFWMNRPDFNPEQGERVQDAIDRLRAERIAVCGIWAFASGGGDASRTSTVYDLGAEEIARRRRVRFNKGTPPNEVDLRVLEDLAKLRARGDAIWEGTGDDKRVAQILEEGATNLVNRIRLKTESRPRVGRPGQRGELPSSTKTKEITSESGMVYDAVVVDPTDTE